MTTIDTSAEAVERWAAYLDSGFINEVDLESHKCADLALVLRAFAAERDALKEDAERYRNMREWIARQGFIGMTYTTPEQFDAGAELIAQQLQTSKP